MLAVSCAARPQRSSRNSFSWPCEPVHGSSAWCHPTGVVIAIGSIITPVPAMSPDPVIRSGKNTSDQLGSTVRCSTPLHPPGSLPRSPAIRLVPPLLFSRVFSVPPSLQQPAVETSIKTAAAVIAPALKITPSQLNIIRSNRTDHIREIKSKVAPLTNPDQLDPLPFSCTSICNTGSAVVSGFGH